MGSLFVKTCGRAAAGDNFMEIRNDGELTQGWHWDEYHAGGKFILQRLEEPAYAKKVLHKTDYYLQVFFGLSEEISQTKLSTCTNVELIKFIKEFEKLFSTVSSWGTLISLTEYEHELVSKKVKKIITKKLSAVSINESIESIFQLVTTSKHKTYVVKERDELLHLASVISKNPVWLKIFNQEFSQILVEIKSMPKLQKLIEQHQQKYLWLSFGFEGPVLQFGDTLQSLIELIRKNPQELIADIKCNEEKQQTDQKIWLKKLHLTKEEEHLLWIARELGFSKAYRKDIEYHGNYAYHLLISEIGRRFYFSPHQGHYLSLDEVVAVILGKAEVDFNLINDRIKHCVYACENLKVNLCAGEEAQAYRDHFEQEETLDNAQEMFGQCACPGKVRGKVKIILDQKDYSKFYAHDILVTYATNPNMVPLMKIAKGIITDMGGITCHAAIVSRELNVPCIIGTKFATKALKDGDLVEMDAATGRIIKLLS